MVAEKQLCEHLSQAQLAMLKERGDKKWTYIIMPMSLYGRPVRVDRVDGGYRVVHAEPGQTIEDLKPGNRSGDDPLQAA